MSILRVYTPRECDEHGVPLDWERCRTCVGTGYQGGPLKPSHRPGYPKSDIEVCPGPCGGHGSLKAAALAVVWGERRDAFDGSFLPRCEGCSHPMSEGTWEEHPPGYPRNSAITFLSGGQEPPREPLSNGIRMEATHFSPCDERCEHDGSGRVRKVGSEGWRADDDVGQWRLAPDAMEAEASWRPVDVRLLSWPHDLRLEHLAVLCLRCWAARP